MVSNRNPYQGEIEMIANRIMNFVAEEIDDRILVYKYDRQQRRLRKTMKTVQEELRHDMDERVKRLNKW